jgi:hypothetical protein
METPMTQARADQTPDRDRASDRLQDRYAAIGIPAVAAAARFIRSRRPDRPEPAPRSDSVTVD